MKSVNQAELGPKEWYIIIENQQLGPFNLRDLERESRLSPDTLVWKKGFKEWIKARFVPELNGVFKDKLDSSSIQELDVKDGLEGEFFQNQATLTLHQDPYQFILWVLVLILIASYSFYRFYHQF